MAHLPLLKFTLRTFIVLVVFINGFMWSDCNNAGAIETSRFTHKARFRREDSKVGDVNSSDSRSNNLILMDLAKKFALRLKELGETELGVPILQNAINALEYKLTDDEEMNHVKKLSEKLESKASGYLAVLNHTVSLIEDFKQHSKKLCFVNVPCIYISENGSYEEPFNNATLDFGSFPLSILNLTEGFTSYAESSPNKNLHYFISEMEPERLIHVYSEDLKDDKCLIMDDPHFQRVFLKAVSKEPKQLVLLVDNGGSLSDNQFAIAKSLASHIILSLSAEDRVSMFAVSDSTVSAMSGSPLAPNCSNLTMVYANDAAKHHILGFIEELAKTKGPTNHSSGFAEAFKTIKESMKNESVLAQIVYISRGLMYSLAEAKTVLEVISQGQDSVTPNVIINTCVLIDDGKTILTEKHFMSTVAQQNFSMHNIQNMKSRAGVIIKGTMISVNSSSNMGAVVRSVCSTPHSTPHPALDSKPVFFLPEWDVNKKELVISIAQVAKDSEGKLLGVVGIDVPWQDLAEDFIFFNEHTNSYVFLVDIKGKAVAHPLLKQPINALYEQPVTRDISDFETSQSFSKIRNVIFQNTSGMWKPGTDQVTYSWEHVPGIPYIVVGFSSRPPSKLVWSASTLHNSVLSSSAKLAYHRLDLANPGQYQLCRNFRQLSSLDTGTLFLSGWCFQSPYKYLSSEQNVSQLGVQSYMAYLKDSTKLLANPGLRPGTRSEIVSAVNIIPYWKKLFVHSSLTKYIVRKYTVTGSGAVIMYPGGVTDHKLDVLRHSWYLRAVQYPGLVTVTPPYLDSAGAGYVVTLSIAVGKNPLLFVLAIDFTLGAMFHLMVESLPSCSSPLEVGAGNVKCFLMDDRGYLIAHPSLIDPLTKGAADEQHHITHRESLLANDLLNHKGLVEKLVCKDFASSTVQRFYQFNMSLDHVVTNMISGEQCVRYQLTHLPGTNMFLGVVNTTCDLVTAFCPCNTVDRHCLNCKRMEQNECECPCECPLEVDYCEKPPGRGSEGPKVLPCPPSPESGLSLHIPHAVISLLPTLKPCYQLSCDQFATHKSCLGVIGCEWCQLQSDGISHLPNPFCTHQAYCYSGILGSSGEGTRRSNGGGEGLGPPMPMGSMGGAMFALLVALSLMVYCYCKHSVRPAHSHGYMAPDSSFHMFNMDKNHHSKIIEEPPTGANTGLVCNAQELSVAAALLPDPGAVSPYRMSAGYRRPPTGDSDHGYSTMTPHEDTEPGAGGLDTPTLSDSPPTPPSPHTLLPPHPHFIMAPVTVHRALDT